MEAKMDLKKGLVLIAIVVPLSSLADEPECTAHQMRTNRINALILVDKLPSNMIPKTINMRVKSDDEFMQGTGTFRFDHCGGLLQANISQTKKDLTPKSIMKTESSFNLSRQSYGWDSDLKIRSTINDTLTKKESLLFDEHLKGVFLMNKDGVISESGDRMEGTFWNTPQVGIAKTIFQLNSFGQLASASRTSNLKADRSNTSYNFDDAGRLIRQVSSSKITEYQYDETGKQLSEKSIQILSTT